MIKIFYVSVQECKAIIVDENLNMSWNAYDNVWHGRMIKAYKDKRGRVFGYDVYLNPVITPELRCGEQKQLSI